MVKENIKTLEKKLWDAADSLRANSSLTVHEYAQPVLGLIFLRFAEFKFEHTEKELASPKNKDGASVVRERKIKPEEYQAEMLSLKWGPLHAACHQNTSSLMRAS